MYQYGVYLGFEVLYIRSKYMLCRYMDPQGYTELSKDAGSLGCRVGRCGFRDEGLDLTHSLRFKE